MNVKTVLNMYQFDCLLSLFSDAVSSSDDTASGVQMITK
jgi:hypothetical protein